MGGKIAAKCKYCWYFGGLVLFRSRKMKRAQILKDSLGSHKICACSIMKNPAETEFSAGQNV